MKILAIRGRNLASLAQQFEVDFQKEPLASAGLFAIVGPTGAGKSTLLDALCLALYEETPRLSKAGMDAYIPDVKDQTLTQQDVRNLLRRGAADGHAEVDFIGNDGIAYRARWSVRRARGKADGALQKTDMSLVNLVDNRHIGGHAKEVKTEIAQRIGLNFAQFTRAVLLAQNEFSAFLKAKENERGELLETLTGTDLYSDISKRAYERNKQEKAALDRLREQLADQQPLGTDERARLEHESALAAAQAMQLEKQQSELEAHLRWHQAWDQAREREQSAHAAWQEACARRDAMQERKALLERVEAVQPARSLTEEANRIAADIPKTRARIEHCHQVRASAQQSSQEVKAAVDAARQQLEQAEKTSTDTAPLLHEARALDAQIDTMLPLHRRLAQARDEAAEMHRQAGAALKQKEEAHKTAVDRQRATQTWLSQHAHLQPLAEGWPRWETLLRQAAECKRQQDEAAALEASAKAAEASARQEAETAARQVAELDVVLADASEKLNAAAEALGRFDPQALAQRREVLEQRREILLSGSQLWQALERNLKLQQGRNDSAARLRASITETQALLTQADKDLPVLDAALAQAERALHAAQLACGEDVKKLRAALRPATPCPVCGSDNHPYTGDSHGLETLFSQLEEQARECRARQQEKLTQRAEHAARLTEYRTQLEAAEQELASLGTLIRNSQKEIAQHPLAAELTDLAQSEIAEWFENETQRVRKELTILASEEEACRSATKARDAAQRLFDLARDKHRSGQEEAAAAASRMEKAAAQLHAISERHARAAEDAGKRLAELEPAFATDPDWKSRWQASPEEFFQWAADSATTWREHKTGQDRLASELQVLEAECQACRDRLHAAAAEMERAAQAWSGSDQELQHKRQARQVLLAGRPVAEVEAELAAAIGKARLHLADCEQTLQNALGALERATESLHQTQVQLEALQVAESQAASNLQMWLDGFNTQHAQAIELPELRTLLNHGAEWMDEERRVLRNIETEVERCAVILSERKTQREEHEASQPTERGAEELRLALGTLAADRERATAHATSLQVLLSQDDVRRKRASAILEEIDTQTRRFRTWDQLSNLIGSPDGKRFRNYAQQFTLDVLLGYANQQLRMLSRRYRLERIRETLAIMVVDQDMGDERRSVHSLSGGESFLVSLALALGLASLSSNRVQVQSLFIDEGFGSLDADTLSVAMDALDGLQAQGRRVGVISHVQEMTERIATQIRVTRGSGGHSSIAVHGK